MTFNIIHLPTNLREQKIQTTYVFMYPTLKRLVIRAHIALEEARSTFAQAMSNFDKQTIHT